LKKEKKRKDKELDKKKEMEIGAEKKREDEKIRK